MKIPSHFYLYGLKIKVKYSSKITGCGLADYPNNIIYLSTKIKSKELSEHTFLHELLHFIVLHSKVVNRYKLDNGKELHADEDFIDNVSAPLHQALTTGK